MFNNGDFDSNGEKYVFDRLQSNLTIFDVGCRDDSPFVNYNGKVHYFEPNKDSIASLQAKAKIQNTTAIFNNFGLSDKEGLFEYFPHFQSFVNRQQSFGVDDSANTIKLQLKTGKQYLLDNEIAHVDFMKIDTEGSEFKVILGFENLIERITTIQFEYGGTFRDASIALKDIIDYLKNNNFDNFSYLSNDGLQPLQDYSDHYQYCNIICSKAHFKDIFTH